MTRRLPGRLAECRACREPIRFVALDTGKSIPVNPVPNNAGTVAARASGPRLVGYVIAAHKPSTGAYPVRFTVHAATCAARPAPAPKPAPDPALF